jgi:competence protein ComEC
VLFLLTWARSHPDNRLTGWLRSLSPAVPLTGLAVLTILVWREAFTAPDGKLHVHILDVSQAGLSGEAILIETPAGREVLINGGPSASRLSDALGRRLPITDRIVDLLVVAGVQNGQLQGLPSVLSRYPPRQVWWAGPLQTSRAARDLSEKLTSLDIPIQTAQSGQIVDLGDEASLQVLSTGQRGAVLLLSWKDFRLLLPMGMGFDDMEALENGKLVGRVSGLLLADSGFAPLNTPEWISNLRPQVVLLSVSPKDTTGLPSPETLQAVEGYNLLRTDRNGWLELSTDGEHMWVEVERR